MIYIFCSGIILQDLTFVHIGNPNMLPETQCDGRVDVINFAKRWQQYTILDNMRRFKAWYVRKTNCPFRLRYAV